MMRIGLDGRAIFRPNRRGTGKNLIDLYRRLAETHPEWTFVLFHQVEGPDDPFVGLKNVERCQVDIPGDRFGFWQEIRLPLAARMRGMDVLHCHANTAPRWPMVPMILTIHDLIPLEPEFSTLESQTWGVAVARAARKARRIITPSEYTRGKIVQELGIPADKVVVNHWAPDTGCRKVTDAVELNRVRVKYGLRPDQPYVFAFGAADPRKNTERLIQAWSSVPEWKRKEFALLLVGIQDWARETFQHQIKELGLEATCLLHGFAQEEDISALTSGATVLCYPSLSEGFGLPILDAFRCETAVVTSNSSSLPEVAGDAAVFVDPRDVGSIARGLTELLENTALREELVRRGTVRLGQFTWEACTSRLARVFEDVCGEMN